MAEFSPAASWSAGRKLAGVSDARQARDVKFGNALTYAKLPFLALSADKVPGEDGKVRDQAPTISKREVATLTPEIYDDEVAPTVFRLTADSAALAVGDTATLVLDDSSGLAEGMLLNNPEIGAEARITSVSGNSVAIKVIYTATGAAWTAGAAGVKNLEKLNHAAGDAPTIGTGTYREQINRTNGLQFSWMAMSQGILQQQLALHGNPGGEGANQDWKREQKLKMIDFQRMRENQQILSPTYYTEGSGDSRIIHSKGMIGWAGGVVPNADASGAISWENFVNVHMAGAREVGGGSVVYALGGLQTLTALTGIMREQMRITQDTEKYKAICTNFETPAGILKYIRCDALDTQVRSGMMITFMPEYLELCNLRGLGLKYMEGLELNNILGQRAAILICEALMASAPKSIKIHTNLKKSA
jgi:hypothetical protein